MMYPYILILVSLSLAKSLSLNAFSAHFFMLFIDLNLNQKFFVDNTNLMSLYTSFRCTDAGASIVFDSSLTGLQMSGLLCLVKYSSVPTPLLYVSCSSGLTLSSGFSNLLAKILVFQVSEIAFLSRIFHQGFAPNF